MKDEHGVETDINKRWEDGIDHHPESERLMAELMDVDFNHCHDHFGWKDGGDGDNGETLMYEFDIIFERRDALDQDKVLRAAIGASERQRDG